MARVAETRLVLSAAPTSGSRSVWSSVWGVSMSRNEVSGKRSRRKQPAPSARQTTRNQPAPFRRAA